MDSKIITLPSSKSAREMVIKKETYIWGKDGEFAVGIDYDLLNSFPHVTDESPTNVYGIAMINNYLFLNTPKGG